MGRLGGRRKGEGGRRQRGAEGAEKTNNKRSNDVFLWMVYVIVLCSHFFVPSMKHILVRLLCLNYVLLLFDWCSLVFCC